VKKEKQSERRAAIKRNVRNLNHHPEKGVGKRSPFCACMRVCECVKVEIRSRFRHFSESEKQDHTRAGAKLENGKKTEKAKKNSAARKIPVSQRIAKREAESYKSGSINLYCLEILKEGVFWARTVAQVSSSRYWGILAKKIKVTHQLFAYRGGKKCPLTEEIKKKIQKFLKIII